MKKMMRSTVLVMGMFMAGANLSAQTEPVVDEEVLKTLRVVEDPDGKTNVRGGPSTKAKVVGEVLSGGVVNVVPEEAKDGFERLDDYTEKMRYIHSSRLKKVTAWKQVAVTKAEEDNSAGVLKQGDAEIEVKAVPFDVKQHKVTKDENGLVMKIDGGEVWGRDGDLPAFTMQVTVNLGGKEVTLPKDALEHLYDPYMASLALLTPGDASKQALVLMMNGDGAGGYCVVWAFQDGKYKGRAVFVPF